MGVDENKILPACPSPDISAYLDGELSAGDEMRLEAHFAGCRMCSADLNLQKTFLNELDGSLDASALIELPHDFTRSVMANAESGVSGLRRAHEWRSAGLICAALIAVSFFALGSNADKTFAAMTAAGEKIFAMMDSGGHFAYDVALGSSIIFRSLAAYFVFESTSGVLLLIAAFVLSLFLFSRLLVRFHRT